MYTPKPINTKDITLPEELLALTEKIAENVDMSPRYIRALVRKLTEHLKIALK